MILHELNYVRAYYETPSKWDQVPNYIAKLFIIPKDGSAGKWGLKVYSGNYLIGQSGEGLGKDEIEVVFVMGKMLVRTTNGDPWHQETWESAGGGFLYVPDYVRLNVLSVCESHFEEWQKRLKGRISAIRTFLG